MTFLIIRLIDCSLSSDMIRWFLSTIKWGDSVITVIIAYLTKKEDISQMRAVCVESLLFDLLTSQKTS